MIPVRPERGCCPRAATGVDATAALRVVSNDLLAELIERTGRDVTATIVPAHEELRLTRADR